MTAPTVANKSSRPVLRPGAWALPASLKLSGYLSSSASRAKLRTEAHGTKSGPTGQEVDAYVAGTMTRKDLHEIVADTPPRLTVDGFPDDDSRPRDVLGLQQENASGRITSQISAKAAVGPSDTTNTGREPLTESSAEQELVDKVKAATNGKQISIPGIEAPTIGISPSILSPNQYGFVDPRAYGGTSFDLVGNGQHEPLNIIVSGLSSPEILSRKGFQSYCRSLGFDRECLGMHLGAPQKAYTDPRGWRDQELLYRQVYSPLDHVFGTCMESLVGGNHIRAWQQQASGAWFLAVSKEEDATKNHMIVPDGYNIGRDEMVAKALGDKKDGKTNFMFTNYSTQVTYLAGLMPAGVDGDVNHGIPVDGLTALLTVKVLGNRTQAEVSSAPKLSSVQTTNAASKPRAAAAVVKRKTRAAWIKVRASMTLVPRTDRVAVRSDSVDSDVALRKEPEQAEATIDLMPSLGHLAAPK